MSHLLTKKEQKLQNRKFKQLRRSREVAEYVREHGTAEGISRSKLKKNSREMKEESQARFKFMLTGVSLTSFQLLITYFYRVWTATDFHQEWKVMLMMASMVGLGLVYKFMVCYVLKEDEITQKKKLTQGRTPLDHTLLYSRQGPPVFFFFTVLFLNGSIIMAAALAGESASEKFVAARKSVTQTCHMIYSLTGIETFLSEKLITIEGPRILSQQRLQSIFNDMIDSPNITENEIQAARDDWKRVELMAMMTTKQVNDLQTEGLILGSIIYFISFGLCFLLIILLPKYMINRSLILRMWDPKKVEDPDQAQKVSEDIIKNQGRAITLEQVIIALTFSYLIFSAYEIGQYLFNEGSFFLS